MLKDLPLMNDKEVPKGGGIRRLGSGREYVISAEGVVVGRYDAWMHYDGMEIHIEPRDPRDYT